MPEEKGAYINITIVSLTYLILKFNYVAMNAIEVAALTVLGHRKYEKLRMRENLRTPPPPHKGPYWPN